MGVLKDGDISLSVAWDESGPAVVGTYTIANTGAARVLVFDRLYQTAQSGFRSIVPALAWRWLEPEGVYRVAKYVPNLPHGMRVESPDLPYARLLEPGASLTGAVWLPARLDQLRPYGEPPSYASVARISGLVLSLGYAEVDDMLVAKPMGAGEDLSFSVAFDWAITRQRLISSDMAKLALPMEMAPKPLPKR